MEIWVSDETNFDELRMETCFPELPTETNLSSSAKILASKILIFLIDVIDSSLVDLIWCHYQEFEVNLFHWFICKISLESWQIWCHFGNFHVTLISWNSRLSRHVLQICYCILWRLLLEIRYCVDSEYNCVEILAQTL